MDISSYILSKKYVEDSLAGAGALAGKSAYEIACQNGFKGSPTEWLVSLRGDTPEIGPNGTWVISGFDTGVLASPSIAGYATEEFVNKQIANIPKVDLTPYATRKELNEALLGIVIPDVSGFATREELEAAITSIPAPDLTPYATKEFVQKQIDAIPEVDLTGYATENYVKKQINAIPKVDLTPYAKKNEIPSIDGLATEDFVHEEIGKIEIPETPDLSPYALKTDIPSVAEFATEEYVTQKIAEAELNEGEVDLSAYYTKSETEAQIREAVDAIEHPQVDLSGLATEKFVTDKIAEAQLSEGAVDLSSYYTKEEVDNAISAIEHPTVDLSGYAKKDEIPSVAGLATEEYVQEALNGIEIPQVDLSNYVTKDELPSTEGLATETFVNTTIAELIDSAPETLDTLGEIAEALKNNSDVIDILNVAIGDKANKTDIPSVEGLASEAYVNEAIAAIEIPEAKADVNVYEISSDSVVLDELIALLPEGVEINQGDVMLVTNELGVKSAYQFDGSWIACDGNVDASKVIMPFDITLAGSYTQVGNLSKTTTGTATFATKGKSVAAALQEILSKREQPSIKTQPKVTLTATSGAKEVGTEVTPTWSASLGAGEYTYGPATGIVAKTWAISDTDGHSASTASGSFAKFTVGDDTNYRITAKATYDDGAVAQDNLGDPSNPVVKIAAGSKSANGSYITGYRAWFMYIGESLDTINSAFIRGTTNKGATPSTQSGVTIPAGTKRVMVAIPANGSNLTSVIDVDGMGLDVFGNFTKINVDVEGLNGYKATSYDVWVAENENGLAATHYNLVIG